VSVTGQSSQRELYTLGDRRARSASAAGSIWRI